MDYDEIFEAYYTLYRTEAEIPNAEDDEYKIGLPLANEAVRRWSNYDGGFWKELFQTAQVDGSADLVLQSGVTDYAGPSDMRKAGGYLRLFDDLGATQARIPIIEPQSAQFSGDNSKYIYFTGDPNNGFTLHINPEPMDSWVGLNMNYIYYKVPNKLTTGTDLPEMTIPDFIVHRMLANRFRGSRNPYYQSAKSDAEDALATMKMEEISGNWADPWKLADNSGSVFGV